MFDRSYTTNNYGPREIHEHGAPTDESVRLLREMEAEARANVLEVYYVANAMNASVVVQQSLDGRRRRGVHAC